MLKKEMNQLKKDYEEISMNPEAYEKMLCRIKEGKAEKRKCSYGKIWKAGVAVAAMLALVVLPNSSEKMASAMGKIPVFGGLIKLVTVREYEYKDEMREADVKVKELQKEAEKKSEESLKQAEAIQESIGGVNDEIVELTTEYIKEFEKAKKRNEVKEIKIESEIIQTTQEYFTLKLICYESAASGYEENYYYTIDLNTGKRLEMKDLFAEGSDYLKVLQENIENQMLKHMEEDENASYWLNDDFEEFDLRKQIKKAEFYINAKNEIVICFQEGDVAAMYMGNVTFTIPNSVVQEILK